MDFVLRRWAKDIFRGIGEEHIYDFRKGEAKEQLYKQKEHDWLRFGYSKEYMDLMRQPEFWENEYQKIFDYDKKIKEMRSKPNRLKVGGNAAVVDD